MRNKLFFSLVILIFGLPVFAQTNSLTIRVTNLKKIEGTVRVCLITSEDEYLSKCINSKNILVDDRHLEVVFNNLKNGIYCVTLYHDIDNNEKLNRDGFFGMPSEPYGFSNNSQSWFGPPSYKKCKFKIDKNINIEINL